MTSTMPHHLAQLGDELERAVGNQITGSLIVRRTRRMRSRGAMAATIAGTVVLVGAGAAAAVTLLTPHDVAVGLPGGSVVFAGVTPTCTTVGDAGDTINCTIDGGMKDTSLADWTGTIEIFTGHGHRQHDRGRMPQPGRPRCGVDLLHRAEGGRRRAGGTRGARPSPQWSRRDRLRTSSDEGVRTHQARLHRRTTGPPPPFGHVSARGGTRPRLGSKRRSTGLARADESRRRTRIRAPEEYDRLVAKTPDRFRVLVMTEIDAGLRWGGLIALRPRSTSCASRSRSHQGARARIGIHADRLASPRQHARQLTATRVATRRRPAQSAGVRA